MIERAGIRFNIGDYVNVEIDTEGPTCTCIGTIDGEPVDFSSGGASNFVSGSFILSESDNIKDIDIGYEGEGYPILAIIQAHEGINPYCRQYLNKYGECFHVIAKNDPLTAPDYSGHTSAQAAVSGIYKYSNDIENSYNNTNTPLFDFAYDAPGASSANTFGKACVFKNNNTLSVAAWELNKYGFIPNVKYDYFIIYSE